MIFLQVCHIIYKNILKPKFCKFYSLLKKKVFNVNFLETYFKNILYIRKLKYSHLTPIFGLYIIHSKSATCTNKFIWLLCTYYARNRDSEKNRSKIWLILFLIWFLYATFCSRWSLNFHWIVNTPFLFTNKKDNL